MNILRPGRLVSFVRCSLLDGRNTSWRCTLGPMSSPSSIKTLGAGFLKSENSCEPTGNIPLSAEPCTSCPRFSQRRSPWYRGFRWSNLSARTECKRSSLRRLKSVRKIRDRFELPQHPVAIAFESASLQSHELELWHRTARIKISCHCPITVRHWILFQPRPTVSRLIGKEMPWT